jgi:arylsulfatase A-like enzyme
VPTPERFRGGFQDWWGFEDTNDHFRCYYFPGDGNEIRFIDGYVTDGLTDMAIDYLRNYDRKAPLFMVISLPPPHFPFEAPEKFLRLDPAGLSVRPNFTDRPGWRENLAVYYAMIENLDENIGRLTDAVRELPRFENTLTVYLSDHGEFGGSHGRMARKTHPHEEGVRIPMIWRWPGRIPAGRRPDDLASIADLMPTTLALAGVPVPDYCQGRDFSPLLRGDAFCGPGAVLLEMVDSPRWSSDFPNWRGVVTDRWKYAVYEDGAEVLFDLDADPFEMKNLADANHVDRSEMRETLLKLLHETGEPFFHLLLREGAASSAR